MSITKLRIIKCPLCGSAADLHHDIRASLVYFCQHCTHEWQIDPAQESPPVAERPTTIEHRPISASSPVTDIPVRSRR